MALYKLTFKGQAQGIPAGFEMQVVSSQSPEPYWGDVHAAIVRNGFREEIARRFESSGNWYVQKIG